MNDTKQKAVINDMELKALVGAHTPGPWRTGGPSDGFVGNVLADNPRRLIAQVTVQDGEQTLANARLMAVAPDLLVLHLATKQEAAEREQKLVEAMRSGIARAEAQHEATKQELSDYKQEVSDAVEGFMLAFSNGADSLPSISHLIIPAPKPDPLVEALNESGVILAGPVAKDLRAALDARGLEIREKNDGV